MKKQSKDKGTPRLGIAGIMKNVGRELTNPTEEAFIAKLQDHLKASGWYTVDEQGRVHSTEWGVGDRMMDVTTYIATMIEADPDKPGWTKWFKPWDHYGPIVSKTGEKRPSSFRFWCIASRLRPPHNHLFIRILKRLSKYRSKADKKPFAEEQGWGFDRLWRVRLADYANFDDIAEEIPDKMEG